jgi:hypothetical protein
MADLTEPITVTRGDTWGPAVLPLTNKRDGSPYNLSGATVVLTVKRRNDRSNDDDDALFQLTAGDGIEIDEPDPGSITVEISDENTELLEAETTYRYDVQIRRSGTTRTPIGGPLIVTRDVTRE